MKRIVCIGAVLLTLAFTLTACGEDRPYTWAIIKIDGETIAEGHVDDWQTVNNGVVFIEIDGKRYRTGYENVVLMEEPPAKDKQEELHLC